MAFRKKILMLATKISLECGTYMGVTPSDPEYMILDPIVTDEMADMIGNTDYLVLESNYDEDMLRDGPYPEYLKSRIRSGRGHLGNNECAAALERYASGRLRHVWLCHLSEENNHPEIVRKTVGQILDSPETVNARHFEIDILKRKSPNGVFEL